MFLRFLLDNKVVDEKKLLEAVIEQYESMPSLLRVLKEDEILNPNELLNLLIESISGNSTVYEVLKKEGRLTPDDLKNLVESQNAKAKSLGTILVEKGFVDRDKFDLALRDYSKTEKAEPVQEKATVEKPVEKKEPSAAPAISAAALESLKAVGGFDPSQLEELEEQVGETPTEEPPIEDSQSSQDEEEAMLAMAEEIDLDNVTISEYLDFYNDDKQSELLVVANRFRLKGRDKDLSILNESVLKLLSLCKLGNFNVQQKLLEAYESLFSQALNDPNLNNLDWRAEPFSMLEILWDFRKTVEMGKSEVEVLADANKKNQYMESIKRVLQFSKRSA